MGGERAGQASKRHAIRPSNTQSLDTVSFCRRREASAGVSDGILLHHHKGPGVLADFFSPKSFC